MRILDPKEEVYKVKITPIGKFLLSQGTFNPVYYAFFDDDIIYDSSFLSGTGYSNENQNDVQVRILDETPKFEGQTSFQGSETTVFALDARTISALGRDFEALFGVTSIDDIFPGITDKGSDPSYNISINPPLRNYYLQKPLAKSGDNSDTAPFFYINMITGSIVDAKLDGSGPSKYFANFGAVPDAPSDFTSQVNFEMQDEITINKNPDLSLTPTKVIGNDELFDSYYVFEDGTQMSYDKKELFLKLEEGNTEFLKENFDIEVFEVTRGRLSREETLKKLEFVKEGESANINNVEYYFHILVDNEIDEGFYCEALATNKNKTKDIFSDNTFKCPDLEQEKFNLNIYNTDKDTATSEKC